MRKRNTTTRPAKASLTQGRAPLIEHLQELKRRLIYVAVSVAIWSAIAYAVEQHLVAVLLRPSHGQHFIYTSPLGGINFLFSVCVYVGIALSLPNIIYQLLKFLQPLMLNTTARFIGWASVASGVVAAAGIAFGYFIGLPAALEFLLHQFHNSQVQALLTIQSYLQFVTAYMFGSALMFQLPLILLFINRIKPLKPSQLLHYERHLIVFAFIAAFIMNPSPNLLSQIVVVVPIIAMYQVGIGFIWFVNRHGKSHKVHPLFTDDLARQAERAALAARLEPVVFANPLTHQSRPQPVPVLAEDEDFSPQDVPNGLQSRS